MTKHLFSIHYILFTLFLLSSNLGFSQDSLTTKSSPSIIYGDFFLGGANLGGEGGFVYGIEVVSSTQKTFINI